MGISAKAAGSASRPAWLAGRFNGKYPPLHLSGHPQSHEMFRTAANFCREHRAPVSGAIDRSFVFKVVIAFQCPVPRSQQIARRPRPAVFRPHRKAQPTGRYCDKDNRGNCSASDCALAAEHVEIKSAPLAGANQGQCALLPGLGIWVTECGLGKTDVGAQGRLAGGGFDNFQIHGNLPAADTVSGFAVDDYRVVRGRLRIILGMVGLPVARTAPGIRACNQPCPIKLDRQAVGVNVSAGRAEHGRRQRVIRTAGGLVPLE